MTLYRKLPKVIKIEAAQASRPYHRHGAVSQLQIRAGLKIISGVSANLHNLYWLPVRPGSKRDEWTGRWGRRENASTLLSISPAFSYPQPK